MLDKDNYKASSGKGKTDSNRLPAKQRDIHFLTVGNDALHTHAHARTHAYNELHQILLLYYQNPSVKHSEHCNINQQVTQSRRQLLSQ